MSNLTHAIIQDIYDSLTVTFIVRTEELKAKIIETIETAKTPGYYRIFVDPRICETDEQAYRIEAPLLVQSEHDEADQEPGAAQGWTKSFPRSPTHD